MGSACQRLALLAPVDAAGRDSKGMWGGCHDLAGLLRRQRDEDRVDGAQTGRDLGNHGGVDVAQAAAEPERGGTGAPREGLRDQRRGWGRDEDEEQNGESEHLCCSFAK